ncbi:MAG: hypothetical protein ABJN69_12125 [Hellea sp.]
MALSGEGFLDSDELYNVVLKILAVTVLIDHRERDRELVEFTHAAMLHNHHLRPGVMLSRTMINEWFKAHKTDLTKKLNADKDNKFKTKLLIQIRDKELQRRLLSSIFTIAVADYELHDEESNFINSSLAIWKTHMPTPAEIEAMA